MISIFPSKVILDFKFATLNLLFGVYSARLTNPDIASIALFQSSFSVSTSTFKLCDCNAWLDVAALTAGASWCLINLQEQRLLHLQSSCLVIERQQIIFEGDLIPTTLRVVAFPVCSLFALALVSLTFMLF